eukprot:18559-Chlamydomonas_euryale.AAC.2
MLMSSARHGELASDRLHLQIREHGTGSERRGTGGGGRGTGGGRRGTGGGRRGTGGRLRGTCSERHGTGGGGGAVRMVGGAVEALYRRRASKRPQTHAHKQTSRQKVHQRALRCWRGSNSRVQKRAADLFAPSVQLLAPSGCERA